nr:hypothetical protein [Tanacetum cinerariifolium]
MGHKGIDLTEVCLLQNKVRVDVVFDGAFRVVGDEEVVVEEGLDEEALVKFMVEWCEEDEDDDRNEEDDLFN